MTMQEEKLEQLQKRIQELVPEIMELKMGCRVIVSPTGNGAPEREEYCDVICYAQPHPQFPKIGKFRLGRGNLLSHKMFIKILGRDIQLADVLLALEKIQGMKLYGNTADYGMKEDLKCKFDIPKLLSLWDFTKPFHQQSPEFHQFLYDILI